MTYVVNSFFVSMLLLLGMTRPVLAEETDVSLHDLQLSEGPPEPGFMAHALAGRLPEGKLSLTPAFDPDVNRYTVTISQPQITIRARAAAGAKMDANGTASQGDELKVANRFSIGNANDHGAFMSATLSGLASGDNVITVNVSDSGGAATRSYTMTVNRTVTSEQAPLGLDDLQLSEGAPKPGFVFSAMAGMLPEGDVIVTPAFEPEVTSYSANVSHPLLTVRARAAAGVEIRVTGTAAGGDALTAGNRSRVTTDSGHGGFLSVTLSDLAAGENLVTVEVTDAEGEETRRYKVVLNRVARDSGDTVKSAKATKDRQARNESPQALEKAREAREKVREIHRKRREVRAKEREARRKEREARRKEQRARNDQKGNDLVSSIRYKDADGVRRAIEAGENVNEVLPGRTGISPLLFAVDKESAEIVRLLIDAGADVNYILPKQQFNSRSNSGISALLMAVNKENVEIIRLLIAAGADVNHVLPEQEFPRKSDTGTSALLLAVGSENEEIVRLLIDAGADVNYTLPKQQSNSRRHSGTSALLMAVNKENVEIIRLLIAAGADVNHVLPEQHFPRKSDTGTSALLLAVGSGNEEIVRLLIDAGADLNHALPEQDVHSSKAAGTSALLLAVSKGQEGIVRLLIEGGADVNRPFSDEGFPARKSTGGVSALILAAYGGHEEMVRLLIEGGADVSYQVPGERPVGKNRKTAGLTALRVARAKDHSGIAELLRKAGAKR